MFEVRLLGAAKSETIKLELLFNSNFLYDKSVMDFDAEFEQISQQMLLSLTRARRLSRHPALRGDSAESIVRDFLINYLPKNLEISTGQIFDTLGNISKQMDIIIHDKHSTPVLFLDNEKQIKLIPVECVYSVIEVKSKLTKNELTKAHSGVFDNMLSVRQLQKLAFYESGMIVNNTTNYGREWTDWPINYFLFAFDSVGLPTLRNHIDQYHRENNLPPEMRIDMVCVLGKGVICNQTEDPVAMSGCPDATSTLRYKLTNKELLLFYTLMSHFLTQVTMRKFNFTSYVRQITF